MTHKAEISDCFLSDISHQVFDEYSKIFTLKLQFISYKEQAGIRLVINYAILSSLVYRGVVKGGGGSKKGSQFLEQ